MAGEWTYHLQDARTGAWLSRDLPLEDVEITDVLTGHCSITGRLVPEDNTLDDLIEEWGNFLYAEKGDNLRSGGILTTARLEDEGNALAVGVEGFTAYLDGQHYGGKFRLWAADPADCLRHLWSWTQARSVSSDLGLVVDNDSTTVQISDNEPPPRPNRASVTHRVEDYPDGVRYGPAGTNWPRPPRPKKPKQRKPKQRERRKNETDQHWEDYLDDFNERLDAWNEAYNNLNKGRLKPWRRWKRRLKFLRQQWVDQYGDREPYKLSWWEETDMGQEAARLAEEGRFEWRERHTWASGAKATVNHRLQLGFPSVGADKRDTIILSVAAGTLAQQAEPESGGQRYANYVTALGAGEGRKTRRATASGDDSRLRRAVVIPAKRVKRQKRLSAIAREHRSYRVLRRHIEEVQVWDDTGNLTDMRLGDIISVQITGTWWKSGTTAHKIVGRRYRPDDDSTITLQLVRAERSSE